MALPLKDKVIAITGGTSGIGLATSKLLSSRGATVCICDLNPVTIESAAAHFNSTSASFSIAKVDISKEAEVDSWIESIVGKYGKLDGAVNAAGVAGRAIGSSAGNLVDTTTDDFDFVMNVNLRGLFFCLRAEMKVIADKGSIVNISSILGVMGAPGSAAYSASKHGVIGLTRSAAKEVGDREIRVNCVCPGSTWTPMLESAAAAGGTVGANFPTAIKRYGTAEELAGIIGFLVGPESGFVTGAVYMGDGGWNC